MRAWASRWLIPINGFLSGFDDQVPAYPQIAAHYVVRQPKSCYFHIQHSHWCFGIFHKKQKIALKHTVSLPQSALLCPGRRPGTLQGPAQEWPRSHPHPIRYRTRVNDQRHVSLCCYFHDATTIILLIDSCRKEWLGLQSRLRWRRQVCYNLPAASSRPCPAPRLPCGPPTVMGPVLCSK